MKQLILTNRKELNKSRRLKEAFTPVETLKKQLDDDVLNLVKEGNWDKAKDYTSSVKEQNALIELFIQIACEKNWGCTKEQLDPGKDILIKIIGELGFKEDENPYLDFMKVFFNGLGKGAILTKDDWMLLNNIYSDKYVDRPDLKGIGANGDNHIIFNPYLYAKDLSYNDKEKYVEVYKYLSNKSNIDRLNLDAIPTIKNVPKNYTQLSNSLREKPTKVRDILMYENSTNPKGKLNSLYWIQKAINTSKDSSLDDTYDDLEHAKDVMKELSQKEREQLLKFLIDNGWIKTK